MLHPSLCGRLGASLSIVLAAGLLGSARTVVEAPREPTFPELPEQSCWTVLEDRASSFSSRMRVLWQTELETLPLGAQSVGILLEVPGNHQQG